MTVAYKKSECFDDTEKIIEKIIEKIKKSSLQYIIETSKEKIERNLNKGMFGLGKIIFRERGNKCRLYALSEGAVRRTSNMWFLKFCNIYRKTL